MRKNLGPWLLAFGFWPKQNLLNQQQHQNLWPRIDANERELNPFGQNIGFCRYAATRHFFYPLHGMGMEWGWSIQKRFLHLHFPFCSGPTHTSLLALTNRFRSRSAGWQPIVPRFASRHCDPGFVSASTHTSAAAYCYAH